MVDTQALLKNELEIVVKHNTVKLDYTGPEIVLQGRVKNFGNNSFTILE